MSLIGEAVAIPAPSVQPPVGNSWTASAIQWLRLGMVGTGVVAMAFWTYHITIGAKLVTLSSTAIHKTAVTVATGPADAAHAEPPAPPPPPPEPAFVLNGVVGGVGEPFAIINGTIVHLGETIEEATLLHVDSGMARLRRKGKELLLQTAK